MPGWERTKLRYVMPVCSSLPTMRGYISTCIPTHERCYDRFDRERLERGDGAWLTIQLHKS